MEMCCSRCLLDSVRTRCADASSCADGTLVSAAAFCRRGDASAGAPHAASCCATLLERRRRGRVTPLIASGGRPRSFRRRGGPCKRAPCVARPARRGTGGPQHEHQQPRLPSCTMLHRCGGSSAARGGAARSRHLAQLLLCGLRVELHARSRTRGVSSTRVTCGADCTAWPVPWTQLAVAFCATTLTRELRRVTTNG